MTAGSPNQELEKQATGIDPVASIKRSNGPAGFEGPNNLQRVLGRVRDEVMRGLFDIDAASITDDQIAAAAAFLGVSERGLRCWVDKGIRPEHARPIHQTVRYRRAALEQWLREHLVTSGDHSHSTSHSREKRPKHQAKSARLQPKINRNTGSGPRA